MSVVTTVFDAVGAVCTAVAAALFVAGVWRPAAAVLVAGLVLLVWSWVWVGAPGVERLRRRQREGGVA